MTAEEWPAAEEWRAIDGYDGWYEVSSFGRVRSWHVVGGPGRRLTQPRIRKVRVFGYGKVQVLLKQDGTVSGPLVHRLVAEAFIGPIPDEMVVCHNDGNAQNNHVDNLRIDTRSGNEADKFIHGTSARGERNPQAKLSESDVRDIRQRRVDGERVGSLAKAYGMSAANISTIVHRRSWKHVA
jgi:hypothetical protein